MKKRLLSLLLTVCLVLSLAPISAFAANGTQDGEIADNSDAWVAQIGDVKYTTLQAAIDAAQTGDTITLVADITVDSLITVNRNVTLDLNGFKIEKTNTNDVSSFLLKVASGTTTIMDSSEAGTGSMSAVKYVLNIADGASVILNSGKLIAEGNRVVQVVGGNFTVNGGALDGKSNAAISMFGATNDAVVTVNGGTLNAKEFVILANGSDDQDNCSATINGGILTSTTDIAIYWPATGELKVTGGAITGATAIYVKSGSLNISGGTFVANGENNTYEFVSSDAVATGDALVIENVGGSTGYEEITSVSITGGTFTSENAAAVASYTAGNEGVNAVKGFISGGTFSEAPAENLAVSGNTFAENDDGTYGVVPDETTAVAEVNGVGYTTLQDAVNAAENGETVTVLRDIELSGSVTISAGMDVTIEGTGKTITGASGSDVFYVTGGKLTLSEGLNVHAPTDCCIYIRGGDVITAANLTKSGTKYSVIQGNGQYSGNVTIAGGIVKNEIADKCAIYWPQNGKLTISGGTVIGGTGIRLSSGSLEITGGVINANGTKQDYAASNGGSVVDTGDAVMIENIGGSTGYEEITSVSITGGTFTSENAAAVASYTAGNEGVNAVTGFISGGTFSNAPDENLAVSGNTFAENDDGTYGVVPDETTAVAEVNGVGYTTLQAAVDAAKDGGTVTLLQNVELDSGVRIHGSTTLDLNGLTISISDTFNEDGVLVVRRGAHLTIADSSEERTGSINGENKAVAVKMTEAADGATGDAASLTVNGGTLIGRYYAISGNGSRDNTSIIINDGNIVGSEYTGIYQPQNGTLTITGGEISGKYKSVDVRSGSLSISGGELKNGLYIENIASGGYEALGTLSITGGVFTDGSFTDGTWMPAIYYENTAGGSITGFISGGTYSSEPDNDYLADGFVVITSTDADGDAVYGVAPALIGTVSISGSAAISETLTAVVSDSNNTGDLSYQWYRVAEVDEPIAGATSRTYTVTAADAGCSLYCVVSSSVQSGSIGSSANATDSVPYLTIGDESIVANGYEGVYDGESHSVTVEIPDSATILYSTDGENWSTTCPSFRDAGSYSVQFRVSMVGYSNKSGSVNVVITPKTITITADDKNATIGDAKPALTCTVDGLLAGEMLTTNPELACEANMTVAGEYEIVVSGADAGSNYSINYVSGKLTVEPIIEYAITYIVDGEIYKIETYPVGSSITMPDVPAKDGYIGEWDKNVTELTSDVTVTAVYTENTVVTPGGQDPDDSTTDPDSPQTGDRSNLWLWFTLLIVSACGVVGLSFFNIKRKGYSGKYMR